MKAYIRCAGAVFGIIVWCCAAAVPAPGLTTEEVILLKEKGVSEETIRLMIARDAAQNERDETSISITRTESGTTWSTGAPSETPLSRRERENLERAWDMLRGMRIELEK